MFDKKLLLKGFFIFFYFNIEMSHWYLSFGGILRI